MDKHAILDVRIHTKNKKTIAIEIQIDENPQIKKRIIYYTSKMYTEQLRSGNEYHKLQKVISILITDFVLLKEEGGYHNIYEISNRKSGKRLEDVWEINTLELPKLPKDSDGSMLWNWMEFIKAEKEEDLEMIEAKVQEPEIKKAVGVLKELSQDERTRLLYEAREKARRDAYAREQGAYDRGREEEREEQKRTFAIKLLKRGENFDSIMELTGMTQEELDKLSRELQKT